MTIVNVRLRPVEPSDLPRMYEMQLDPESNRMAATIPRSAERFEAHWANVLRDPHVTAMAILLAEEMVGNVSCFQRDGQNHVGYWVSREHWGKGIASQALRLLLLEVADRPLYAHAGVGNGASLRVLQKCGFVIERVLFAPADERHSEGEVAVLVLTRESLPRDWADSELGVLRKCQSAKVSGQGQDDAAHQAR